VDTYHQCKRLACLIFGSDDLNTITSVLHYLRAGQSSVVTSNVFPLAEELIFHKTRTPSLVYDELASNGEWLCSRDGEFNGQAYQIYVFVSLYCAVLYCTVLYCTKSTFPADTKQVTRKIEWQMGPNCPPINSSFPLLRPPNKVDGERSSVQSTNHEGSQHLLPFIAHLLCGCILRLVSTRSGPPSSRRFTVAPCPPGNGRHGHHVHDESGRVLRLRGVGVVRRGRSGGAGRVDAGAEARAAEAGGRHGDLGPSSRPSAKRYSIGSFSVPS
jgi:hypothetical protein